MLYGLNLCNVWIFTLLPFYLQGNGCTAEKVYTSVTSDCNQPLEGVNFTSAEISEVFRILPGFYRLTVCSLPAEVTSQKSGFESMTQNITGTSVALQMSCTGIHAHILSYRSRGTAFPTRWHGTIWNLWQTCMCSTSAWRRFGFLPSGHMTLLQRRLNVDATSTLPTLSRRCINVMCPLGGYPHIAPQRLIRLRGCASPTV